MIFKTIEDDLGKTKFGINDSFKGLFNGSFFKGEKLLSDNDIRALQAYNAEIERGVSPMTAYYRTMQDASDAAVNMAQSAGEGTVQINNMTKASKAASIGLKGLAIAGNIGLALLISWGLPKLIELIDNAHTSTKELKEQFEELKQEFSKVESELDSVNSELETTVQRLRELENKDTLTFVEQEEYDNLKRTSAELERQNALLEAQLELKDKEKNNIFVDTMNSESNSRRSVKILSESGKSKKELEGKELVEFWDNEILKQLAKATNRKASAKTQEELDNIQNLIDKYSEKAMAQYNEYAKKAEGITYIPKPTTETDRQVNEWLDYINDYQDRMMIAMGESDAKTNAFNRVVDNWYFDETIQELQDLGKQGQVTAEMLNDPKYDEFINKLVELGIIDSVDNLEDIALAFNGVTDSVENASDSVSKYVDRITVLSITETAEKINSELKPVFDDIKSAYQDIFSLDDNGNKVFDLSEVDIDTLSSIKSAIASMNEIEGVNIATEVFEEFAKVLTDTSSTAEDVQAQFDNLVSAMLNQSNIVNFGSNVDVLRQTLEQLGVVNIDEVLADIINAERELIEYGIDLENITNEQAVAFINEAKAEDITKQYLEAYVIQKQLANENALSTVEDIENLELLCEALGASTELMHKFAWAKELTSMIENTKIYDTNAISNMRNQLEIVNSEIRTMASDEFSVDFNFKDAEYSFDGLKDEVDKFNKSATSGLKDTAKTFDWIETLISRIQRNITNLGKLVSATYRNWSTRNNALAQEMAEVNKEINAQMTAYNAYMAKANSIGLSDHYKNLVMNGGLKIEDIGNDALREQIESFKEYYEKALDASDAIEDLRANLAELAMTKFNNVSEQYDEQISLITHNVSMLEGFVSQSEAAGYMASEVYYKAMAEKQQENITQLQGEYSSLLSAFDEAVKSGSIEKYSEDWYNMLGSINDVELELQDATTQLIEFNQTLQQLSWEVFDRVRESVNDITTEAEFLIDVLDSKDLHTDKGVITDEGLVVQGLHAVNYNTYMEQALAYVEEMRKIEAEMAKDPYDIELIDRRNELLELQQEAISSAMSEKEAMHSLWEEGYNKMLDSLDKLIAKRKEALQATKDMYDYENTISEKTSNISSLQKQLQAYSGDNSESAKATIQKLQVSLAEAEKDLQQTEYERYVSDQEQMLDTLYNETEQWVNQRLDDIDGLISESIDATNKNAETISNTIKETANSYGYEISDQMETIWDSANDVVCTYGDILKGTNENIANNITTGTTNVVTAINGLNSSMQTMIGKLNEIATANKESIAKAQNAAVNSQSNHTIPTTPTTPVTPTSTSQPQNTGSTNKGGGGNGTSKKYALVDRTMGVATMTNVTKEEAEKYLRTHPSWAIVELEEIDTKTGRWKNNGYYTGTNNAKSGIHKVSENGDEIILTNDGNAILAKGMQLFPFQGGETVFDASKTAELLKGSLVPLSSEQLWGNIVKTPKLPEMSKGVGGNVTYDVDKVELVLPNVKDYDSFVTEMQHDKRFERIVQSMTTDRLAGKGSLNKYKF